jgi:hypothetical protein
MPPKPKNFAKQPIKTNPESNEDSDTDHKKTFKLPPAPDPSPQSPSQNPLSPLKAAAIIAQTELASKIYSEQSQLIYHSDNQNLKRYTPQIPTNFQETLIQKMRTFHSTQDINFHFKIPKTFATDDSQYLDFGGFYINGLQSGFGILVWPGTKRRYYEGNFIEGKIDGESIKLWGRQRRCVFEGTIRGGLKEGHCRVFDEDGIATYEGVFVGG